MCCAIIATPIRKIGLYHSVTPAAMSGTNSKYAYTRHPRRSVAESTFRVSLARITILPGLQADYNNTISFVPESWYFVGAVDQVEVIQCKNTKVRSQDALPSDESGSSGAGL